MNKKKINVLFFIFFFLFSIPASAEVTVRDWDRVSSSKNFKWYVAGVGSGFFWANIEAGELGLRQIYCQPSALAVNADNYMEILKKELNNYGGGYNLDTPLSLILLYGLKRTFPCHD